LGTYSKGLIEINAAACQLNNLLDFYYLQLLPIYLP